MKEFTEYHHAHISAMFYKYLAESQRESWKEVFLLATRRYAEQRGSRMAQRALKEGQPLDFASYRHYGEWQYSEEFLKTCSRKNSEIVEQGVDITFKVTACPWSQQYLKLGMLEGAEDYCADLDAAIVRGFNPELTYIVDQTMHVKQDYCLHTQKDAHLERDAQLNHLERPAVLPFDYHCGHIFKTYSDIVESVYGAFGRIISTKVLEAFANEFGYDMADRILSFKNTNFDILL